VNAGNRAEDLANEAADAVRRVVAAAEERAAEIVKEAEAEAARIKERAETEANERLEGARHALDDLRGRLEGGGAEAAPGRPPAEAVPPPPPPPEAETPAPEPVPEPMPAPEPLPEPVPPGNGDDAAARLMAMKLAIDGKGREEIAYELDTKFGTEDRNALLDDVLARAGK
jgi:outer membrane biosynthesis protein TonB